MGKRFIGLLATCVAAAIMTSCMTTRYIGPTDHVDFRAGEKMRSSAQSSALKDGENQPLVNTYDQENAYDAKGNLIKVKLTEYVDRLSKEKKYIVWETDYKVIGGSVVPASMSANGVPFLQVEYELLAGAADDKEIVADIMNRPVNVEIRASPISAPIYSFRNIALDEYTVGFAVDGRFVERTIYYGYNGAAHEKNTLTLGWGNIAIKRFYYSMEKLSEGIAKTYTGYNSNSEMFKKMSKGISVEYGYEWKVVGSAICQTKMVFTEKDLKLEASTDYNADGKRTKETWFLSDPSDSKSVPRQVFAQELAY